MVYYINTGLKARCECERVHRKGCPENGNEEETRRIGNFEKINEALAEARNAYPLAKVCLSCFWNDNK